MKVTLKCLRGRRSERERESRFSWKGKNDETVKSLVWITYVVDHEVHDCLRHYVPDGLVDDAHVGVNQVTNGFHLALQLGVYEAVHSSITLSVHVGDRQTTWSLE